MDHQESRDTAPMVTEPTEVQNPAKKTKISRTKRSKVACRHCRRRKVRCDVYPHGSPCTNCRLDGIDDCEPCHKKPRRYDMPEGPRLSKLQPLRQRRSSSEQPGSQDAACESNKLTNELEALKPLQASERSSSPTDRQSWSEVGRRDSIVAHPPPPPPRSTIHNDTPAPPQSSLQSWSLPAFLCCDLSRVSFDDLTYLQNKGCFTFPDKDIVDELLQCYFDYIAPHMPFIDETSFCDMYHAYYYTRPSDSDASAAQSTLSLLLFQAMLFAATTCAPMTLLRRLGYSSRCTARRDAFFRVRALYSLDTESDNLVLVQTFLLMSYWRGEAGEDKDSGHWIGLAVSMAQLIGLHRRPQTPLSQRQDTVRRRCWWSCVVRDRLVALAQHRQPMIQIEESDVPILTLADYNVSLRNRLNHGLSAGEELGKKTALSMFSVKLIRLLLCMDSDGMASIDRTGLTSPNASETWAKSRKTTCSDDFAVGHTRLDDWRANIPEVLQRSACPDADDSVLPCILVLRNALQIYYHKIILSIVTPRLLSRTDVHGSPSRAAQLARTSSLALAKLHEELVDRDSVHCIPPLSLDRKAAKLQNAVPRMSRAESTGTSMWSSPLAGIQSQPSTVSPPVVDHDDSSSPFGYLMFSGNGQGELFSGVDEDIAMLPDLAPASTAEQTISTTDGATSPGSSEDLKLNSLPAIELDMNEKETLENALGQGSDTFEKDMFVFSEVFGWNPAVGLRESSVLDEL